jgi:rhodanese-related sulfurtransferase
MITLPSYVGATLCRVGFVRALLVSVLYVFASTTSALAEQSNQGVPEALKGIKQANGVCSKETFSSSLGTGGKERRAFAPDLSCSRSIPDVAKSLKDPDTVVIDTRVSTQYVNSHMDGAINLPLDAIKTKAFLRNKEIILVGSGKSEEELYTACAELKANGFRKAAVLRGGMPFWLGSGHPSEAQMEVDIPSVELTAAELWSENRFQANLVIVGASDEMHRQLPGSLLLKDMNSSAIRLAIDKRRRDKKSAIATVVLVGASLDDIQVRKLRNELSSIPLLFYRGTAEAYKRAISQQNAVWLAQVKGPKQPKCGL